MGYATGPTLEDCLAACDAIPDCGIAFTFGTTTIKCHLVTADATIVSQTGSNPHKAYIRQDTTCSMIGSLALFITWGSMLP